MIYVKTKHYERLGLSEFPNFHRTGSISGMKKLYYGRNANLVQCGSYIYNVPESIYNQAKVLC